MKKETLSIKLTFLEPVLGSAPGNRELLEDHIASKAPTTEHTLEEIEAVPAETQLEKGTTIFPRDDKGLFLWDYQMRGAFKESLLALIELGDIKSVSKWGIKRAVDSFVFVDPRKIYLRDPQGAIWMKAPEINERPLRAQTLQGERVAIARSEQLPAGSNFTCNVVLLTGSNEKSKSAALKMQDIKDALHGIPIMQNVLRKARVDCMPRGLNVVADIKKVQKGCAAHDEFQKMLYERDYFVQAASNLSIIADSGIEGYDCFTFIVVEASPPYLVATWTLERDSNALRLGALEWERRLAKYARCAHASRWPGFPAGVQPIDLSHWAIQKIEGR